MKYVNIHIFSQLTWLSQTNCGRWRKTTYTFEFSVKSSIRIRYFSSRAKKKVKFCWPVLSFCHKVRFSHQVSVTLHYKELSIHQGKSTPCLVPSTIQMYTSLAQCTNLWCSVFGHKSNCISLHDTNWRLQSSETAPRRPQISGFLASLAVSSVCYSAAKSRFLNRWSIEDLLL